MYGTEGKITTKKQKRGYDEQTLARRKKQNKPQRGKDYEWN